MIVCSLSSSICTSIHVVPFFGPWLFSDHTIYLSKPRLAERLVLLRWSFMTCTRKKAASRSIFFCRNFAVHVRASHLWIDRKCVATLRCGPEKVGLFELTFFGPHHLPLETATCETPYASLSPKWLPLAGKTTPYVNNGFKCTISKCIFHEVLSTISTAESK